MEKWTTIKKAPNYQVSNFGNVVNSSGANMKKHLNSNGYYRVFLYVNGIRTEFMAHRLVAEEFIGINTLKKFVNHIDGNKINNHVSNLEWCTHSENCKHSFRIGLQSNKGVKNPAAKITDKIAEEIRRKHSQWISVNDLMKEFKLGESQIRRIINYQSWV